LGVVDRLVWGLSSREGTFQISNLSGRGSGKHVVGPLVPSGPRGRKTRFSEHMAGEGERMIEKSFENRPIFMKTGEIGSF
jgi:hypothetical protein